MTLSPLTVIPLFDESMPLTVFRHNDICFQDGYVNGSNPIDNLDINFIIDADYWLSEASYQSGINGPDVEDAQQETATD